MVRLDRSKCSPMSMAPSMLRTNIWTSRFVGKVLDSALWHWHHDGPPLVPAFPVARRRSSLAGVPRPYQEAVLLAAKHRKRLIYMEARVGIEPALTDLQSAA